MKKYNELPSVDVLREYYAYNPDTGIVTWLRGRNKGCPVGRNCGGGLQSSIHSVSFMLHRAIWKMVTGSDPVEDIDHENRNGLDNRWLNLREATTAQNMLNRVGYKRKINVPRGVYPYGNGKWLVLYVVMGDKKKFYLGDDYEMACAISYEAAMSLHGRFHRDQRADFDAMYGFTEPEREWYPDGPFVGVRTSGQSIRFGPGKSDHKTGHKGIRKIRGVGGSIRFQVDLWYGRKKRILGDYDTLDEAIVVRQNAERLRDKQSQ